MWNMNRQVNGSRAKAKQDWSIGNTVNVGFLTLQIVGLEDTTSAYGQKIFNLVSLDGSKKYQFSPHEGLARVA